MEFTHEYDARGLICPMPVLKARKQLQSMPHGAVLRLMASDPAAVIDVPHFCQQSGHVFERMEDGEACQIFYIRAVHEPAD